MRTSISQIRDFHVFSWAGALFSWPFRVFSWPIHFRVFRVFSWAGALFSWPFRGRSIFVADPFSCFFVGRSVFFVAFSCFFVPAPGASATSGFSARGDYI